ncbi:hypothetical protein NC652_020189 [Populus alba x Populus x berolinensis]|nr:hypothetical protein NC652_020189 [Populus alba x Populus x berolinensis]
MRDLVTKNIINVQHVHTTDQLADLLTKPLSRQRTDFLRNKIGLSDDFAKFQSSMELLTFPSKCPVMEVVEELGLHFLSFEASRSNTTFSCCQLMVARLAGQLINRSLLPTDTTGTMGLTCCSPYSMAHLPPQPTLQGEFESLHRDLIVGSGKRDMRFLELDMHSPLFQGHSKKF